VGRSAGESARNAAALLNPIGYGICCLSGIAEWGLWQNGDRPEYLREMWALFKAHAGSIAYENYYNASKSHMLYPSTRFRAGAAAYRDLWGR
jgi:hypothetical protein